MRKNNSKVPSEKLSVHSKKSFQAKDDIELISKFKGDKMVTMVKETKYQLAISYRVFI